MADLVPLMPRLTDIRQPNGSEGFAPIASLRACPRRVRSTPGYCCKSRKIRPTKIHPNGILSDLRRSRPSRIAYRGPQPIQRKMTWSPISFLDSRACAALNMLPTEEKGFCNTIRQDSRHYAASRRKSLPPLRSRSFFQESFDPGERLGPHQKQSVKLSARSRARPRRQARRFRRPSTLPVSNPLLRGREMTSSCRAPKLLLLDTNLKPLSRRLSPQRAELERC
jgi:hypothetical protein